MKSLHRLLAAASAAFFFASTALAQNPGAVTNHAFALGKGPGQTGFTSLLCGSAQLAVGQSAADPICRTLTGDVTIDAAGVTAIGTAKVTSAMLRNSGALSVIGRSANSSGVPGDISCTAASDGVLRENGSVLGCGTVATAGIANNAVTDAKLRQGGALSLIGRSANSSGNVADISASAGSSCAFRESSNTIGCGTLATAALANNAVTDAKLRQGVARSVIGVTGNATANVADIQGATDQVLRINGAGTALAFGAIDLSKAAAATGVIQAASFPAMTGDVTSSAGALATTIAANAVTNAKMATMAAYTLKCNNSGSTGTPTDCDITAFTSKPSPVSGDIVLIQDSAASNAFKRTTVGALASAGSVASYNGRTGAVTATGTDVPLRSYLAGLTLSTAGSSATFGIAGGVATDSTNVSMMALASAYTKTTSSWAVGTATGALDTGTIANSTWYKVFEIQRPDTGVVDICITVNAVTSGCTTGGNIPTAYTLFRYIGSMKTNGSAQWTKFIQDGDLFMWDAPVNDVNATNPGTSAVTRTLTVPTGVRVQALVSVGGFATSSDVGIGAVYLSDLSVSDQAAAQASAVTFFVYEGKGASSGFMGQAAIFTNTSAQIRSRIQISNANNGIVINSNGWRDTRGKDS